MKYMVYAFVAGSCMLFACSKIHNAPVYTRHSSRGSITVHSNGAVYTSGIDSSNNTLFYFGNGVLPNDTRWKSVDIILYTPKFFIGGRFIKFDTAGNTGTYTCGSYYIPSFGWTDLGGFNVEYMSPGAAHYSDKYDTTHFSYVIIDSYTYSNKVYELKGRFRLMGVIPDTAIVSGEFDIRR